MTSDHPSNPPSQEIAAFCEEHRLQSDVEPALERLIDSALTAQEARHKAAQDAGSLLLEGAGVRLREAEWVPKR